LRFVIVLLPTKAHLWLCAAGQKPQRKGYCKFHARFARAEWGIPKQLAAANLTFGTSLERIMPESLTPSSSVFVLTEYRRSSPQTYKI
jgi:acetone carboxylase gamma subunit